MELIRAIEVRHGRAAVDSRSVGADCYFQHLRKREQRKRTFHSRRVIGYNEGECVWTGNGGGAKEERLMSPEGGLVDTSRI